MKQTTVLTFGRDENVTKAALQRHLEEAYACSDCPKTVYLELNGCKCEDGVMDFLAQLIQDDRHIRNRTSRPPGSIESLRLISHQALSLRNVTALLTACCTFLHSCSMEIRNQNIITCIEKSDETETGSMDDWTDDIFWKTSKGVEVTVSSVNIGAPETLDLSMLNDLGEMARNCSRPLYLSLGPFRIEDEGLELITTMLASSKNLQRMLLSIEGGKVTSSSLSLLTNILKESHSSLQRLELLLSNMPRLFRTTNDEDKKEQVQQFATALASSPLNIVELEHVGLDECSFVALWKAMAFNATHLWISDKHFLGKEALHETIASFPFMNQCHTLSIVDSEPVQPPKDWTALEKDSRLLSALHRNTGFRYFNMEIGLMEYLPSTEPDRESLWNLWKRNELLSRTRHVLEKACGNDTHSHPALWPRLIQTLGETPESGLDSIHQVVRTYFSYAGLGCV